MPVVGPYRWLDSSAQLRGSEPSHASSATWMVNARRAPLGHGMARMMGASPLTGPARPITSALSQTAIDRALNERPVEDLGDVKVLERRVLFGKDGDRVGELLGRRIGRHGVDVVHIKIIGGRHATLVV